MRLREKGEEKRAVGLGRGGRHAAAADLISQTLQIKATCFSPGSRKPSPEQTENQATGRKTNRGWHQLHLLPLGPAPGLPAPSGDGAAPGGSGGKERGAGRAWGGGQGSAYGVSQMQDRTQRCCPRQPSADTHNGGGKDTML